MSSDIGIIDSTILLEQDDDRVTEDVLDTEGDSDVELVDDDSDTHSSVSHCTNECSHARAPCTNECNHAHAPKVYHPQRNPNPQLPETAVILESDYSVSVRTEQSGEEPVRVFKGNQVILVGTAHFSPDSQNDVRHVINETRPDVVMVELCNGRGAILSLDEETLLKEAQDLSMEKIRSYIRQSGLVQGILHILLLSMSAHITKQLGMAPGGEFRAAAQEAALVGSRLELGDRPISITLQRALGSLSIWQKIRLFVYLLFSHRKSITQEDVERCKEMDLLEQLLSEMSGEFPELSRILVHERDQFMAAGIQNLLRNATARKIKAIGLNGEWEPVVLVAVLGIGHVPGIKNNWLKPIDMHQLMTIPEPSKWPKYTILALKGAFVGMAAYFLLRYTYSMLPLKQT